MSGLMSLGTRAMFANYAALQTTGSNIANAGTEGYSRQQVELSTAGGQYTGAGFFGQGVKIDTVTRAADAFLTREAASSIASGRPSRYIVTPSAAVAPPRPSSEGGRSLTTISRSPQPSERCRRTAAEP